jgi:hypothetical protein
LKRKPDRSLELKTGTEMETSEERFNIRSEQAAE